MNRKCAPYPELPLAEPKVMSQRRKNEQGYCVQKKTVASATETSCCFARIAGATAAIALPPHIAVPTVTSSEVSRSARSNHPIVKPRLIVTIIPITV